MGRGGPRLSHCAVRKGPRFREGRDGFRGAHWARMRGAGGLRAGLVERGAGVTNHPHPLPGVAGRGWAKGAWLARGASWEIQRPREPARLQPWASSGQERKKSLPEKKKKNPRMKCLFFNFSRKASGTHLAPEARGGAGDSPISIRVRVSSGFSRKLLEQAAGSPASPRPALMTHAKLRT